MHTLATYFFNFSRKRLEEYERNCSADGSTGKCSETHRACQFAVTKILGTELHASCVCKGTDFLHKRDCYTWQKLLWSNPCVSKYSCYIPVKTF